MSAVRVCTPDWVPQRIDWSRYTIILLKPDCVRRDLVDSVLGWLSCHVQIVDRRIIQPTESQIFAHYDDMLPLSPLIGRDVPAELRRIFVGQDTCVALGYGQRAAPRVRALVGPTDPAVAPRTTIRGRYGVDSMRIARREGRLIDNLIHTSDSTEVVARDFGIWFTPADLHLVTSGSADQPASQEGSLR